MIGDLFKSYDYIANNVGDGLLFTADKSSERTAFWLVIKSSSLGSIVDRQSELFDACKKSSKDSALDKNISMLVLWETDGDLDLGEMKKKVISVEEDPFFFKKHILYYSTHEIDSLNAVIGNDSLHTLLQKNIASQEVFAKYKEAPFSREWQPLLYRISIKVPFVDIDIGFSDSLDSLFEKNNEKIEKNRDEKLVEIDRRFFEIKNTNATAEEYLSELLPVLEGKNDGD
ncbi:ABC-three component system middle component 1 [Pseudomonadota bacterium]